MTNHKCFDIIFLTYETVEAEIKAGYELTESRVCWKAAVTRPAKWTAEGTVNGISAYYSVTLGLR